MWVAFRQGYGKLAVILLKDSYMEYNRVASVLVRYISVMLSNKTVQFPFCVANFCAASVTCLAQQEVMVKLYQATLFRETMRHLILPMKSFVSFLLKHHTHQSYPH